MKTEVLDSGQFQNRLETSFHSLALALRAVLWRENSILPDHSLEPLDLPRQFGSHRDGPNLPALELRADGNQPFPVENVSPFQGEDLPHSHARC
jgi:hypothetical protein